MSENIRRAAAFRGMTQDPAAEAAVAEATMFPAAEAAVAEATMFPAADTAMADEADPFNRFIEMEEDIQWNGVRRFGRQ